MDFGQLMAGEVAGLAAALYVVGMILKRIPGEYFPDWVIPFALLVLGALGGMALMGWDVSGAVQGVLAAGTAVLANQLIKQVTTRE